MPGTMIAPVDLEYTHRLPKIELHAHLTGSISRQYLHDVWATKKKSDPLLELEDPLTAISPEHDIKTFFPLFSSYIYKLINDLPSIETSTESVLDAFQADNTLYLELRTTPRAIPSQNISKALYIRTILFLLRTHNTNPSNPMKAHLILSIDRRSTAAEAEETVDLALSHRDHGVVGLDLCGDPRQGDIRIFTPAFTRAKAAGLKLTLHFAEDEASASKVELETLLSWGPERLGHVIHVDDEICERIEKEGIGLELCLSCNVKAGMVVGGYGGHHFGRWWRKDIPVVICTDDVGVFCSPLSEEYIHAATHFHLDREQIKDLAQRPIECIFGGEEEKERLRSIFRNFVG